MGLYPRKSLIISEKLRQLWIIPVIVDSINIVNNFDLRGGERTVESWGSSLTLAGTEEHDPSMRKERKMQTGTSTVAFLNGYT